MNFLTTIECEDYTRRIGPKKDVLDRQKLGTLKKRIDFTYRSRLANARLVATEIVSYLGDFASALLWTHGLVWGDRTQEHNAPQDWVEYGLWRTKLGATAGLFELPGQLFDSVDRAKLVEGVERTIYTGSDAIVLARPTHVIVHLSHDDLISIHCNSKPSALHALERLGLRRNLRNGTAAGRDIIAPK
jgi:hypothetical protein